MTSASHKSILMGLYSYYIVCFLLLAAVRWSYPYEIDSMEGGHVAMVDRLVDNQPLYSEPTLEYIPFNYPPLFFYASAWLQHQGLSDLASMRLVSILGSMVGVLAMVWFLRRSQKPWYAVVCGTAVFLGYESRATFCLDAGRVDAMAVGLALLGLVFLFITKPRWFHVMCAGILVALSVLTKQTMIFWAFIPTIFLLGHRRWQAGLLFSLSAIGSILLGLSWLGYLSDPWFYYYVFKVQASHHIRPFRLLVEAPVYLLLTLPAVWWMGLGGQNRVIAFPSAWLKGCVKDPWAVLLLGVTMMALLAKGKDGGGENVFVPVAALAGLQIGLHLPTLYSSKPKTTIAMLAIQWLALFFLPSVVWPTAQDVAAGDRLVQELRTIPGEVYVPAFPLFAKRAGKNMMAHYSALCDITQSDRSIRNKLGEAIKKQQFAAVIPRMDIEAADLGICDIPDLEEHYTLVRALSLPRRPTMTELVMGIPSLFGQVHGGKLLNLYVPKGQTQWLR